jgi:hypothetical protein
VEEFDGLADGRWGVELRYQGLEVLDLGSVEVTRAGVAVVTLPTGATTMWSFTGRAMAQLMPLPETEVSFWPDECAQSIDGITAMTDGAGLFSVDLPAARSWQPRSWLAVGPDHRPAYAMRVQQGSALNGGAVEFRRVDATYRIEFGGAPYRKGVLQVRSCGERAYTTDGEGLLRLVDTAPYNVGMRRQSNGRWITVDPLVDQGLAQPQVVQLE